MNDFLQSCNGGMGFHAYSPKPEDRTQGNETTCDCRAIQKNPFRPETAYYCAFRPERAVNKLPKKWNQATLPLRVVPSLAAFLT